VSDDHGEAGAAVPSFGDLFDDPSTPYDEPATPPTAAAAAPAAPVAAPAGAATGESVADEAPSEPEAEAPQSVPDAPEAADVTDEAAAAGAGPIALVADGGVRVEAAPEDVGVVPPITAAVASAAAAPASSGRLYRSAGAEGPATLDAIPAIDPDYFAGREATAPAAEPRPAVAASGGGLTWTGVVVVTLAATVIVGFADALLNDRLGWLTGLALLVSSVYSALVVRRADIWAAALMPPLAFVAAVLTAGQLTLRPGGGFVTREGLMIVETLAENALWIIGTTLVCLVIVMVRRRRTPSH